MEMKKELKVIISGGGTGGHIFPAISIANAIKEARPDAQILFVGALGKMEMEKVPAAGYEIKGIPARGLKRPLYSPSNISVAIDYLKCKALAKRIIREFKPNLVVGVGGYASAAIVGSAAKMGIPVLLQEQNSFAGLVNRKNAKDAAKICVAYDGMERFFPKEKIILTGNPVRKNLLDMRGSRKEAMKTMGLDENKKCVLIVGGSLGARSINEAIIANIEKIRENSGIQFIWQTGKLYFEEMKERCATIGKPENLTITDFVSNMAAALGAADLVISRAGAGSISEFALLGKAVILVPSPNVSEDHQTKNAMALVEKDAAIHIPDAKAKEEMIRTAVETVLDAQRIATLEKNVEKLGKPNAAEVIADEVIRLADAYMDAKR